MPVTIGPYTIEDQTYRDIKAAGHSIKQCEGCGVLLEVRDVRTEQFCIECQRKATYLKRYENRGYHPNANDRQQIMKRLARAN